MSNWQLKIEEPSGETRYFPLTGATTLGRDPAANVVLRDPTVAPEAATVWPAPTALANPKRVASPSPYWIRVSESGQPVRLWGFAVRETQIPPETPIQLGETRITLQLQQSQPSLPPFPNGVRAWLTQCEEGRKTLWTAKKVAATPLSVYLAGETGVGKEVLAHLLHAWSDRAAGPFVPLHCGALPLSLAESELFGHVKGAFTGAVNHRAGALMQAHGGTLFLDEIGDLPMDIQVKLLRFLEDGEIRPVGSDRASRADVRLVCATHHPLKKLVEEGKFRRDLYYRIASVMVEIPTLRSRPDDVKLLATRFASDMGKTLSLKAALRLQAHAWPGNVRELRHAIERACGVAGPFTSVLDEEAFEFLLTPDNIEGAPELELGSAVLSLAEMERAMLLKALRISRGNRAGAAKILGVARSTLFEMLKRHKIVGPRAVASATAAEIDDLAA